MREAIAALVLAGIIAGGGADRLASVHEPGQPTRDYLYDPNGNLVEIREAGIPVLTATQDAQDRLLAHGRFTLTHTGSGHLASKLDTFTGESTAYHYDELGNLFGVDLPDGRSIQYLIDGADRRVAKLVDGELQWLFVYAGGLPIARLFPDGSVESIYVYGALAHVPDLVIKAGRTYRIIYDHLGSPRLIVDVETGAIAQRLDYDVHGRVLLDTNPDFQPFAFAGGLHDVDTGLVRFGARDYDPALARWTAKDPSGFAGGDTNLYAYAYGDPVNFIDPNGELAFLVPLAFALLEGALVGAATDAGIELATQLIENGGDIDCLDWGDVTASGVGGAMSGAVGGVLGKAITAAKTLRKAAKSASKPTAPYKRPSGATTPAQRASVQGKPCVDCGAVTPKQVADHKTPLVKEHYETGTIDTMRMRSADAVQPQCPTCSARQGAEMSRYSREQRQLLEGE
jgi:RHS repeat-associated protein